MASILSLLARIRELGIYVERPVVTSDGWTGPCMAVTSPPRLDEEGRPMWLAARQDCLQDAAWGVEGDAYCEFHAVEILKSILESELAREFRPWAGMFSSQEAEGRAKLVVKQELARELLEAIEKEP